MIMIYFGNHKKLTAFREFLFGNQTNNNNNKIFNMALNTNHLLLNMNNMEENAKRRKRAYVLTQKIRQPYNEYDLLKEFTNDTSDDYDIKRMTMLEESSPVEVQQELQWLRIQLCEKNNYIRKLRTELDISVNEIQMREFRKTTTKSNSR